jgi:hypothetical protein
VAGPYGGHVASPGRDTCQANLAFLAYGRTNTEVTRVTTHRVTRGTLTSAWMTWQMTGKTWQYVAGQVAVRSEWTDSGVRRLRGTHVGQSHADTWHIRLV